MLADLNDYDKVNEIYSTCKASTQSVMLFKALLVQFSRPRHQLERPTRLLGCLEMLRWRLRPLPF